MVALWTGLPRPTGMEVHIHGIHGVAIRVFTQGTWPKLVCSSNNVEFRYLGAHLLSSPSLYQNCESLICGKDSSILTRCERNKGLFPFKVVMILCNSCAAKITRPLDVDSIARDTGVRLGCFLNRNEILACIERLKNQGASILPLGPLSKSGNCGPPMT